jgi:hypothetical protein
LAAASLSKSILLLADLPLADGNRIQYNFVKPHMALDGQTPAQAAGIKARGWNELLRLAITNQAQTTKEEQP